MLPQNKGERESSSTWACLVGKGEAPTELLQSVVRFPLLRPLGFGIGWGFWRLDLGDLGGGIAIGTWEVASTRMLCGRETG